MKNKLIFLTSVFLLGLPSHAEVSSVAAGLIRDKFTSKCQRSMVDDQLFAKASGAARDAYCRCGSEYLIKNTTDSQWLGGYADANKHPYPWLKKVIDAADVQCSPNLLK